MGVLDGKVVAVTGVGRGIGREIALLAAREGGGVLVNDYGTTADCEGDSDNTPAAKVVQEIEAAGGKAVANFARFLFSKPRPIRSMHRSEGWTAETIASDLVPAFKSDFYGMDRSPTLIDWDPI